MCPSFCWKTHSRRRHHSLLLDACEIFCHASRFFCDIMDPASYLIQSSLLPRPSAVTSRRRSSQTFPKVHTRRKRYCSCIQYDRNYYRHKTRRLYCVECPQYSTQLEALAYLYMSSNTMSPVLRPTSVPSGILIHPAIWPQ